APAPRREAAEQGRARRRRVGRLRRRRAADHLREGQRAFRTRPRRLPARRARGAAARAQASREERQKSKGKSQKSEGESADTLSREGLVSLRLLSVFLFCLLPCYFYLTSGLANAARSRRT